MSFQLLVKNLLSEEDCRALQKKPSETLVPDELVVLKERSLD